MLQEYLTYHNKEATTSEKLPAPVGTQFQKREYIPLAPTDLNFISEFSAGLIAGTWSMSIVHRYSICYDIRDTSEEL